MWTFQQLGNISFWRVSNSLQKVVLLLFDFHALVEKLYLKNSQMLQLLFMFWWLPTRLIFCPTIDSEYKSIVPVLDVLWSRFFLLLRFFLMLSVLFVSQKKVSTGKKTKRIADFKLPSISSARIWRARAFLDVFHSFECRCQRIYRPVLSFSLVKNLQL